MVDRWVGTDIEVYANEVSRSKMHRGMTHYKTKMVLHVGARLNDDSILPGLSTLVKPMESIGNIRKRDIQLEGGIHENLGIVTHRCD